MKCCCGLAWIAGTWSEFELTEPPALQFKPMTAGATRYIGRPQLSQAGVMMQPTLSGVVR